MGYHDDQTEITKTALNVFCDSPLEYYHQFITGQMPWKKTTAPMTDGIVLHGMFLENKPIDSLVGVYPDSCINKAGGLIGANTKKHRDANPELYWMKVADRDRIMETYNRLKDTAITSAIEECSHFEQTMRATVYGTKCKCRPDIAGDVGPYWVVYDLKFTPSIRQFPQSSRAFRYWLQDAHYSAVIQELTGKPVVFKFIAAETCFPYRVFIHSYNPIKREMAARYHKSKICDLQACMNSGIWTDKVNEDLPLSEWDCECGDVFMEEDAFESLNQPVDEETNETVDMPF